MSRLDLRLVPAALSAWLVTAAGMVWAVGPAMAVLTGFVAAAAGWWRWRAPQEAETRRVITLVILAAAIVGCGFALSITLRSNQVRHHPITAQVGLVRTVEVVVSESPRPIRSGRLLIKADLRRLGDGVSRGRVVIFAPMRGYQEVDAGRSLTFRARIGRPSRHDLTVATLNATGEPTLGATPAAHRAASAIRSGFAARARDVLPAEQAAMLPALVLGDTSAVSPEATTQFRTSGLTHLTAVSGANVTIVCGAVLVVAGLIGPRAAAGLAAAALIGFVFVVQPTASVLRAAVMGAVALLAVFTARRRQAIPALSGSVIVLLVVAPQLAVDVGFALSVSATAALVLLAPWWSAKLVHRGWPKPLADAVSLAAAAQVVTAPLVAGISGQLSLVSVGANLVVAPVVVPITVLGTAAAALCPLWPGAAGLLIRFTGPEVWWLLRVAQWAAAVPHASVGVPSGAVGVALLAGLTLGVLLGWRYRWVRLTLGALVLVACAWALSG